MKLRQKEGCWRMSLSFRWPELGGSDSGKTDFAEGVKLHKLSVNINI